MLRCRLLPAPTPYDAAVLRHVAAAMPPPATLMPFQLRVSMPLRRAAMRRCCRFAAFISPRAFRLLIRLIIA